MSSYNHLTLKDRECILLGVTLKDTYQVIAQRIGCSKATVSREIKLLRRGLGVLKPPYRARSNAMAVVRLTQPSRPKRTIRDVD